jgi:D-arabinose 1-dehydrogenase-like Zn-dependent alcohol dehydrogenase
MNNRCAHRWAFSAWRGPLAQIAQDLPAPQGTEVTVRVTHCGVCHSDLHLHAGGFDMGGGAMSSLERAGVALPVTMGHEIGGEVVEPGPQAHGIAIGERVVVYPWLGCGACPVCERGDEHLCARAQNHFGLRQPGGYSDLVRVPHPRYLVPIGSLAPERAATFACAGITAYSALRKLGTLAAGDHVAIVGCGGVGMTAVALASTLLPARVVAIDTDAARREAALGHGAALAFDPGAPDAAKTISKACGFDIAGVLDFVGAESTSALAVNLARRAGTVVIVGLFGGEFRMPLPLLPLKALQVRGSFVGSLAELRELIDLAQRVSLPRIPIRLRPLAQVNEVLDDLANGRVVGRVVLQP